MKRILLLLTFFLFAFTGYSQSADIVVTNTNNQNSYVPGTQVVYNISVTNFGPNDATNVEVINEKPTGITTDFYWEGSNTTFGSDVRLYDRIAKLKVGEIVTYTIKIDIPLTFTGDLISTTTANSVAVGATAAVPDPNNTLNSVTDTDVKGLADIVVVNTDNTVVYTPGQTTIYTSTVTNNGPTDAFNVVVKNAIPGGIIPIQFSWTGSNGTSGTAIALSDVIPMLPNGATVTYTITVAVPSTFVGFLINKTEVFTTTEDPTTPNFSTDTDILTTGADLVITNTDNQDFYIPGQLRTYNIKIKNNGLQAAQAVHVTNAVPAGTTMTWLGDGGLTGNGVLDHTIPTLANGAEFNFTVKITVPAGFTGDLISETIVTSTTPDPNPNCDTCKDIDKIQKTADIVVTNTNNQTLYNPGDTVTYTVIVKNNGPDAATNVQLTDVFPVGVAIINWSGTNGSNGGSTFSDTIATLANGATVTYTIAVKIPTTFSASLISTVNVTSDVTDPIPACANCTDTDIMRKADIVVTNTDNQSAYIPGGTNTYIVTVKNNGPDDATNVTVTNGIPPGITQFSWTGSNGSSGTNTALNNTIALLPNGTTVTYAITLQVPLTFTGSLTSQTVTASLVKDPVPTCVACIDTDILATGADIVVINTDNKTAYTLGGTNTYTVTVTNNGPQAATNVNVINALPAGITAGQFSWIGPNNPGPTAGAINETLTLLNAGQSVVYTITVAVPAVFTGNLTNITSATSIAVGAVPAVPDPNPNCIQCSDTDIPPTAGIANVVFAVSSNQASATVGTSASFTLTVTNNGTQEANTVHVTNPLPTGITTMNWVGTNGSSGSGMLDNTIALLPAGTTITYTIIVQIPLAFTGNITDIPNVTSLPTNATCTSPSCTAITTVTPVPAGSADVSITITEALISPLDTQYIAGKQRDYTVTVKNNGPGTATGVLVKSNIPSGINASNISWTGNSLSNVSGPLNNTITTLASGAIMIYHVFVKVPSDFDQQTNLVQQVTVTSTSPDPIPSNGVATDTNTPTPYADLVVMKTDNKTNFDQSRMIDYLMPDPDHPGEYVDGQDGVTELYKEYSTYTISVFNYGPSIAKQVKIKDLIPVNPNSTNAQIAQTDVTWRGSNGTSGTGDLNDTIAVLNVGENITYTITVYIPQNYNIAPAVFNSITNTAIVTSDTPDPQPTCPNCTDVDQPNSKFMFVSNDPAVYSTNGQNSGLARGFIENVLIRSHCASIAAPEMKSKPNTTYPTGINSSFGVAYFNKKNADFPFVDGIVLTCGNVTKIPGPNNDIIDGGDSTWPGDSDLESSSLVPSLNIPLGRTNDASYLKFNFIPSTPELKFNFLFASEEYSRNNFECTYSDVFAFILTDITPGFPATPSRNLAVIPNTTTPVKVTTIHLNVNGCDSGQNMPYYGRYNDSPTDASIAANAPINLNGQTKMLQAKATVIPGHTYTIKLVIADDKDNALASAVFIEGGSFDFEAKISGGATPDDLNYGVGNEVCNGKIKKIHYGDVSLEPQGAIYSWAKNGVKIAGETHYDLDVTESGIYTATITFGSGCKKTDDIEVIFRDPLPMVSPEDITICGDLATSYTFPTIDQNTRLLSSVNNPADYEIGYYHTKAGAEDQDSAFEIPSLNSVVVNSADLPKKVYVRMLDTSLSAYCPEVKEFTLKVDVRSGTISYPSTPCVGTTSVLPTTTNLTPGGTYTVTTSTGGSTTGVTINPTTGELNLSTSNTIIGSYIVHYTIPEDLTVSPCPIFVKDSQIIAVSPCNDLTVDSPKTVCPGDSFDLHTYGNPPTGTTYAWSLGSTPISSIRNPVGIVAPTIPNTYNYILVPTIGGIVQPSLTVSVTVLALPVVAFTQSVSSVCTNNPVNVVIQGPAGASVTYKENGISHTDTLSTPGGTYTIVTTATNTTYNYELVSSQYGSTPSCTKTYAIGDPGATSTVNVGLPDATIAIQGASPICSGGSSTVRISGTIGASVTYKKDGVVQSAAVIGTSGYVDVGTGTLTANSTFELTNVATTGTNSCSKAISGQSVTIFVIALPTVTGFSTTTPSICSNTTGTLNFTGTPNSTLVFTDQANTIYPALVINALGSGTSTTLALTADTTFKLVSITMTASPFCSNTTLTPVPVTITVSPLPTASTPAAITLCEGEAGGTLSITATGTAPFTYQWSQGSIPYPGGTGSTLNLGAIASNAGSYTCEVTDKCNKKVTSAAATVTITAKPVITQQPQTTQPVVCSGDTIDITMTATPATGATYQWFRETGSVNSPITGNATATTNHLVINGAQVSDSGDYSCVVTTCGAGVTSSILTITVNPLPVVTGFSAVASSVCKNAFGQLVFTGTPGAEVYYTVGSTPYGPEVLDASGTKTITTPVAITASTTFTLASVSTTGTPVCTSTTFAGLSPVTIDINALPVINSQPSAAPVCEGDPDTVLSVSATGAGLQYEWKLGSATVGTNSTLNVPSTLANNGNSYSCIVTDACGQPVTSSPVTITVTARPVITQDPQGTPPAICAGSAINLTIMATPSTGSVSYQWYREVSSISSAITGNATASTNNLVINNAQVSDSAGYYCVVTTCASVQSLKVPITVNPLPEVTSFTTSTASVCYNKNGTLDFAGTPDSEIIYKDQTGALYPPVTTNGAGIATVSTPYLTVPMTYTLVSITMVNTPFCSNTTLTQSTSIAIKPDPVVMITASATTICEGDASIILDATVTAGTGIGPFTYQWKKGSNVVAGATGSTLTLTSQASNSGSYTCTVTDDCTRPGLSTAIAIVINVKPTVTVQPIGSTICSKVSIDLRVVATPAGPGLAYEWQFNGVPITGNPTATTNHLIIANAQVSDSGDYTCIVSNGACKTTSNAATMIVNQAPVISQQPKAKIMCEGDSYTLEVVVTGGTNVTYQWYKDGNIQVSETNSTLELNPAAVSQTGEYYCIVSSASCLPETSDKVKLTVKPLPTASITEGPTATICEGSSSEVVFSGTPNAVIVYTINNGPQRTIILGANGQAVLLTGILTQTATYTLIKVTENDTNACSNTTFGSSQAVIKVIPIISPELKDGYICVDTAGNPTRTYTFDTGLKAIDGYTFIWTLDGLPLTETGETLIADRIGKYRVEVTNTASGCKGYAEANVQQSSPPTGITVNISGFFAENATVVGAATPLPTDNYVYRLDDGPYQESPVFQGVAPGEHVIYAWDTQFCGTESSVPFSVIGYPRFFTPNGDGINDTWKIDNDSFSSISNARIYIFDRFGKLIKEISTVGDGWDGTFNSTPLPADDYWFSIKYEEQGVSKEFKAHFALKR